MARSGLPSLLKSPVTMASALKFGAMRGGVKKTWPALLAQSGCSPTTTQKSDRERRRNFGRRRLDMNGPRGREGYGSGIHNPPFIGKFREAPDDPKIGASISVDGKECRVNMQETATAK